MSIPAWLPGVVGDVVARAGGSVQRGSGDMLAALVTARTAGEFDVVLEVSAAAVTLRVWGLERRHELPRDAGDEARAAAALRALDDWLALLAGDARLVVLDRAGAARSWSIVGREPARRGDRRWHPAPPPTALRRWIQRWRRRTLVNRFLDGDAVRAARASAEAAAAAACGEQAPPSEAARRLTAA